jgi:hypothetical protein
MAGMGMREWPVNKYLLSRARDTNNSERKALTQYPLLPFEKKKRNQTLFSTLTYLPVSLRGTLSTRTLRTFCARFPRDRDFGMFHAALLKSDELA